MINILFLVFLQIPTVELPLKVSGQPGAFIKVPAKTCRPGFQDYPEIHNSLDSY